MRPRTRRHNLQLVKDFQRLSIRYKQFGGLKLVLEYSKLGALWPAIKTGFRCAIKRQSFKQIYPVVLQCVEPFLIQKYAPIVSRFKFQLSGSPEQKRSKIIWFCWLQGLEQAPPIVKACYSSLKRHLSDRELSIIDNENWKKYIELPDYILNKWEKGRIPAALFSDLLRLELLIKYGGTWVDSTVLCTELHENQNDYEKYLDADLFLFQYTKQGSIPVSISNWFITACSNNEVLIVLRDMLYAYWKDFDCTLDYYIFHLFFSMLSKEYQEEILAMPYGQSMNSLALMRHWSEPFDDEKWNQLTYNVSFHKLDYRVSQKAINNKNDFYNWVIENYCQSANEK